MNRANFSRKHAVTVILIAINIAYLVFMYITGSVSDNQLAIRYGALYVPAVIEGHQYYRLITAMFMHFGAEHLFGNMVLLYALGRMLEEEFGAIRYTVIYLAAGIVGNIASTVYYMYFDINTISAGASGAVFGLVGVTLWLIIDNRGKYRGINLFRIILMIVFALYSGWTGSGINNIAHVGGLAAGFILGIIFYRKDSYRTDNDRRIDGETY